MKPKAGENGEQKSSAFFGHMVSVASGNFSMQESAMVTTRNVLVLLLIVLFHCIFWNAYFWMNPNIWEWLKSCRTYPQLT